MWGAKFCPIVASWDLQTVISDYLFTHVNQIIFHKWPRINGPDIQNLAYLRTMTLAQASTPTSPQWCTAHLHLHLQRSSKHRADCGARSFSKPTMWYNFQPANHGVPYCLNTSALCLDCPSQPPANAQRIAQLRLRHCSQQLSTCWPTRCQQPYPFNHNNAV